MSTADDFLFIEKNESPQGSKPPPLFNDYHHLTSGKVLDLNAQIVTALRQKHPELIITTVPTYNINLLSFAAAGFAQAELDEDAEPVLRFRGFLGPSHRGGSGQVADSILFARYNYTWNSENFIFYSIVIGISKLQYILKEPVEGETTRGNSSVVGKLLGTIGAWLIKEEPAIYVYDGYWMRSTKLWEEVKKAKWKDVILKEEMKKAVTEVAGKFFDSKEIYEEYGVPWKRGVIFHGPVGNGKTISLKALMHTLYDRKPPVVTLYVKSAPYSFNIRAIFQMARAMAPCMLVMEDIDTIVTKNTRSYFFNEVDGLENNDGILMVATTNHLDQLDPGLSQRPSRFDRKYLFPMPDKGERALYAHYWYNKLKNKKNIDFPEKLCDDIADITDDFSFAYMKEAFVATLLELVRGGDDSAESTEEDEADDGDDPHEESEFWRVFQAQVKTLRGEMGSGESVDKRDSGVGASHGASHSAETAHHAFGVSASAYEDMVPLLDAMGFEDREKQPGEAILPLATRTGGVRDILEETKGKGVDYGSMFGHVHRFAPEDW